MKYLYISIIGSMIFFSCAGQRPDNLGIHNNRLTACPAKPNCINTQAEDTDHFIEPFGYTGKKQTAFQKLKNIITTFKEMTIITENPNYLHIECRSAIVGFVDDLEFYFQEEKRIQIRSASRLGYSDFGVNRKRVEQLRKLFTDE